MIRLKNILNSKRFYICLILITIIYVILNLYVLKKSKYNINDKNFQCVIDNYIFNGNELKLELKCKEKMLGYYYFNTEDELKTFIKEYSYGDKVEINGILSLFDKNKNFNTFNYKEYQYNKNIFYKLSIKNITKVGTSSNIIYRIKNYIRDKTKHLKKSNYIDAFILNDESNINTNMLDIYQKTSINYLIGISTIEIMSFIFLINLIMKKDTLIKKLIILTFILFLYLLSNKVSILKYLVLSIIVEINKRYKFKLNNKRIVILLISIILLINPNFIKDIGFYYSIIITISMRLFKSKNKLFNLIKIFLVILPLNIYNNSSINLISFLVNILIIQLIKLFIYPLCLISIFLPFIDNILSIFINFLEQASIIANNLSIEIIFAKPSLIIIVLYYLIITIILKNPKLFYILLLALFIHYNIDLIIKNDYVIVENVGQGDSSLIHISNNNILIDTGGILKFDEQEWKKKKEYSIVKSETIPMIKSLGIRKIDYLIITHGDYDHMGEAINFVNNFKVEKVIFNCGTYNELEQELIKVLDKKKIKYYSCIKELNIDKYKLRFLNTKEYDNENDNSSVIYFNYNNYKFLFMGDAGIQREKDILEKYTLKNIDFFKVGHHGSNTSSSKYFINNITPRYSLISVGKNNRYGHPKDEVLETLKNSKIYRTDEDGSIMFKIKNNKLHVETCSP